MITRSWSCIGGEGGGATMITRSLYCFLVWNYRKGPTCIYCVLFWTAICSFIMSSLRPRKEARQCDSCEPSPANPVKPPYYMTCCWHHCVLYCSFHATMLCVMHHAKMQNSTPVWTRSAVAWFLFFPCHILESVDLVQLIIILYLHILCTSALENRERLFAVEI